MEEVNKSGSFIDVITGGIIVGLVTCAITMVLYLLDLDKETWVFLPISAGMFAVIYLSLVKVRKIKLNGYLSYGRALGWGTLMSLFGGLLIGVFYYLLCVLDPGYIEALLDKTYEEMVNWGLPEDQINTSMAITARFTATPIYIAVSNFVSTVILGFIGSLVIAAVVKRTPDDSQTI